MIGKINKFLNTKRMLYPWAIGGVVWLAWLVNFIGGKGILDLAGKNKGTDFMAYFSAGKMILMGRSPDLYNIPLLTSIQQLFYGTATPGFYPYLYPPHYALFMVPFALLPYTIAYLVWTALGFLCLWLSIKWLGIQKPFHILLFSLTWFPVFAAVSFGQNSFFSLAIFCLTYHLWTKNRDFPAGLVFSLLLFKPQFMVFLGFLWLLDWRKSWKALVGLGIGLFIQLGLNFLFYPEASISYLAYAQSSIVNFMFIKEFPIWNSFSVQAFWLALLPANPKLSQILFYVCVAVGISFFIVFWKKYRQDRTILFAAAILWLVWSIPYIFVYDWTLLVIPALILWNHKEQFRSTWRVVFAILWIAGLLGSPLAYLQLKVFPIALQIGIPALLLSIILIYRVLVFQNSPPGSTSTPGKLPE
jgi:alpha-1,2-mannosyltransferase